MPNPSIIHVDYDIASPLWAPYLPEDIGGWLTRIVDAVCEHVGLPAELQQAELAVLFVDDATIQSMNATHRQQDAPTDVLSFPLETIAPGTWPQWKPSFPYTHFGDIVLSFEYITAQCEQQGYEWDQRLIHLLVHGILHLFGFDHERDEDARLMEDCEDAITTMIMESVHEG